MKTRTTAIQNNFVEVAVPGSSALPVLVELQGLRRKDAATLASCISSVLDRFVRASNVTTDQTIVHVLVGDGVSTNRAAAEFLWGTYQTMRGKTSYRYWLFSVKCASHQANLAVRLALKPTKTATATKGKESDDIEATCSRLYKHILLEHRDRLVSGLHQYLYEHMVVLHDVDPAVLQDKRLRSNNLVELYSEGCSVYGIVSFGNCHFLKVG